MTIKSSFLCGFLLGIVFLIPSTSMASLRDPTKPVVDSLVPVSKGKEHAFNLQSILIGNKRHLATINGKLLGVGSIINGARVLVIDKNRVVLLNSGHKEFLYLFGNKLWTAH